MDNIEKWDRRFLALCETIATWSKDPSTKFGCVIVDNNRKIISTGYNGFPKHIEDRAGLYEDRETKYLRIIHGEANALLNATASVKGCTLYGTPFPPCSECAKLIIQAGITTVVCPVESPELKERWGDKLKLAEELFKEANVALVKYDG